MTAPGWVERASESVLRVRTRRGGGSAIAWSSSEGATDVVTNQHVLASSVGARVEDRHGNSWTAGLVAASSTLDVALLRVNAELPVASLGESRSLRLGEVVLALGHPWGRPWTLTRGLVSGLGSTGFGGLSPRELIRTDVRLAPGNSGGPLLSARGEVIGVNTMIWGGTLGVAVPSHVVEAWRVERREDAAEFQLGITGARVVLPGRDVPGRTGIIVTQVEPDGRASRADLRVGDVLITVNGLALPSTVALREHLLTIGRPKRLTFEVWRAGQILSIDIRTDGTTRAA